MNHRTSLLAALSPLGVALGLAACGGQQQQATVPENTAATSASAPSSGAPTSATPTTSTAMTPNASEPESATAAGTTSPGAASNTTGPSTTANESPGMPNASSLDDSQVAAVVAAINQGEVQQAELAENKAVAPSVKRFAQHMLTAHRKMEKSDAKALSKAQITPSDNTISNQMKSDGRDQLAALQSTHGRDFDRQYVDDQVRGHQQALEFIDHALANVKNADLRADLTAARPEVQDHLQMAQTLQQQLQTGQTNAQPAGSAHPSKSSSTP